MVQRLLLDRSVRVCAAIVAAVAVASGCSSPGEFASPQFATRQGQNPISRIYRLGIGDKLKVSVFGEDNLSGQFEVNAVGQISMPLIGEMPAKGLAIHEFRESVARKLADGYLKNPKVNVEMLNYRPIFVHGEVKNGGEYAYKNGISLRDAIAMAGGYTYRAEQTYLYVGREGEPDVAVKTPADIAILPGDNIRIPERFF
ncbi:MAG TPA: polysaccharide biosynthesis/export family protein [Hyphomicrobium sp.]|nr:polysaccharide biosynthesis/export family protein [Hyphomicrobium sp.]